MKALAVAAGIVFWTLVLGVAVLMFFPGGEEGEPVAVVEVDAAPPAPAAPPAASVDLPPGFSVAPPAVSPAAPPRPAPAAPTLAPPGQGTTMVPVTPGQLNLPPPPPPPPGPQGAAPAEDDPKVAAADLSAGIDQTGSIPLDPVPVPALVEESPYGPLPKVATDGRRPAEVYARPSDYAKVAGGPPRVAVLLSGLGVPGAPDGDIIKGLPPPVSIAYGAYGRSLQERVSQARAEGHEVLLAIPLEPNNYPAEDPGPHTLLTTLPTNENIKRLQWLMSRYTGYVGVTNYMGAKFETTSASLKPVLEEVKQRGLIYFDDGTVESSTAGEIAKELELEYAAAKIQLEAGAMDKALAELEAAAKAQGAAIGVAKAEPATVKRIADWAGSLEAKGLVLVPVSTAMRSPRQS
jgi:polysaccharide deacetylase 2 family uncharacterized protein YibQ